jgi:polysaccharide chain length determinant protein (PEP-CTERM system associated)
MVGALIALIHDEARRIWCYKWLALLTTAAILCAAAVYVTRLPEVYDAWGQVYVNKQTPVAAATEGVSLVGANYGSPYVVTKTLLNDQNLETVVRKLNPAASSYDKIQMARAVGALRGRIQVAPDQGDGFFEFHFQDNDPVRARDTVQMLLDEFVSRNLTRSQRELSQAGKFLDEQIAAYEAMLASSQVKIANFRRDHPIVAAVPQPVEPDLLASDLPAARAAYEAALAQAAAPQAKASPAAEMVFALQGKLAALRTQYTEQHPDVVALKRQLADAVAKADEEARAAAAMAAAEPTVNPAVEAARRRLQEAQRHAVPRRIVAPAVPPELQTEWAELQRNDEVLRVAYQQLIGRREGARMSQAVYGADGSGKYQVTRRPVVPNFPIGPNRPLLMALAAFVAVGGGLAAAYLMAAVKGIFVSPRELEHAFQLPVVGTVSWEPAWSTRPALRSHHPLAALRAVIGGGAPR